MITTYFCLNVEFWKVQGKYQYFKDILNFSLLGSTEWMSNYVSKMLVGTYLSIGITFDQQGNNKTIKYAPGVRKFQEQKMQ